MKNKQELLKNAEKLQDKARGVMAGLAIGDSFGYASRKPENQLAYGITTDFGDGASWSTDDTEFGLLTARTLIACGGKLIPIVWMCGGDKEPFRFFTESGEPLELGRGNTYMAICTPESPVVCEGMPEQSAETTEAAS